MGAMILIIAVASASMPRFLWMIMGEPYVYDNKVELGEKDMIFASFGRYIMSIAMRNICTRCANVWCCAVIGYIALSYYRIDIVGWICVFPIAWLIEKCIDKYAP